jgi:TolB-like protein
MKDADKLIEVLKFYRFHEPVPVEARSHMLRARKETLKRILREKGKYSLLVLLAVNLFYLLKKFGISITLTKSVIIATMVSVLTAGSMTVTAYYIVIHTIYDKPDTIEEPDVKKNMKEKEEVEGQEPIKTDTREQSIAVRPPVPPPLINIMPFKHDKSLKSISDSLTKSISNSIKSSKGSWAVTTRGKLPSGKRAGKVLFGSVARLGDKFIITARLVDRKSSRVLQFFKETAGSQDDLKDAGKRIISRINKYL